MSEIKLFKLGNGKATEIAGTAGGLEKSLQVLMETNLEAVLGVRFIASEHSTGKLHGGRIDSLGLDEDNCPVILEYKRATNENVISQGLYYLNWLLDHKAEFHLLVLKRYSKEVADAIDWSSPRLICVAANFTKFDEHAVREINRNIDLVRYRRFGDDLLALELLTSTTADALPTTDVEQTKSKTPKAVGERSVETALAEMDERMRDLWEGLRAFVLGLGDDVTERPLKLYMAFRRIKNFASVVVLKNEFLVFLKVDPDTVTIEEGFTRDVRNVGHWGTGDLSVTIKNKEDLKKAEPLFERSYAGE